MPKYIIMPIVGILYYALAAYALVVFSAPLLISSLVLFGLPAALLAHFTRAPQSVLFSVSFFAIGLAMLLEGVAHMYGLWYTVGAESTRIFSVVPLEMVVAVGLQVIFLTLVYELVFDDGKYTARSARERFTYFISFAVAVTGLLAMHIYMFDGYLFTYSYVWLLAILAAASLTMVILHRAHIVPFLDRFVAFAAIGSGPLLLAAWIGELNVHKVFALETEYLARISIGPVSLPLEELLLVVLIPLVVAVVYELYLDDQA